MHLTSLTVYLMRFISFTVYFTSFTVYLLHLTIFTVCLSPIKSFTVFLTHFRTFTVSQKLLFFFILKSLSDFQWKSKSQNHPPTWSVTELTLVNIKAVPPADKPKPIAIMRQKSPVNVPPIFPSNCSTAVENKIEWNYSSNQRPYLFSYLWWFRWFHRSLIQLSAASWE